MSGRESKDGRISLKRSVNQQIKLAVTLKSLKMGFWNGEGAGALIWQCNVLRRCVSRLYDNFVENAESSDMYTIQLFDKQIIGL